MLDKQEVSGSIPLRPTKQPVKSWSKGRGERISAAERISEMLAQHPLSRSGGVRLADARAASITLNVYAHVISGGDADAARLIGGIVASRPGARYLRAVGS